MLLRRIRLSQAVSIQDQNTVFEAISPAGPRALRHMCRGCTRLRHVVVVPGSIVDLEPGSGLAGPIGSAFGERWSGILHDLC
jgi:hypothetical protein